MEINNAPFGSSVDLAGTKFLIDHELMELRSIDGISSCIDLMELADHQDYNHYYFFYDTRDCRMVRLFDDITQLPKDTVLVQLPTNSLFGSGDHVASRESARIIPIDKCGLKALLDYNAANPKDMGNNLRIAEILDGHEGLRHAVSRRPLLHNDFPTINIENTLFVVDVEYAELREKDYPKNVISFKKMVDKGMEYAFSYDRLRKRLADPSLPATDAVTVGIPQMVVLDPERMAMKYGIGTEELKGIHSDSQLKPKAHLLNERLNGELPKIDVFGRMYTIDLDSELLSSKGSYISLYKARFTEDGTHFFRYLNTKTWEMESIRSDITELPEHVVRIDIPNPLVLDPVGTAKRYGLSIDDVLRFHPVRDNVKARVVPLEMTRVPELVMRNKRLAAARTVKTNHEKRKKNGIRR